MTDSKTQTRSLLYLDDDPMAIRQMQGWLQQHAALVRPDYFGAPKQAIAAHRERAYDIVISDLRLGTTTGLEVIREMKTFAPDAAYILVSGDADLSAALAAVNEVRALRFMVKPCTAHDVEQSLLAAGKHLDEVRNLGAVNLATHALNKAGLAIVSFDLSFRLAYANAQAEELLEFCDVLGLSQSNQLVSAGGLPTPELHNLIKASYRSDERRGLAIACGHAGQPASIVIYPLNETDSEETLCTYDMLLIDAATSKQIDPPTLSQALNISLSEARVVQQLACGFDLEEAARSCNLSLSTVRTYLKNAYAKTGASRQSELVSLALRTAI